MKNLLLKCLLVGVVSSVSALADMNVDKSTGVLVVTSTVSGTLIAKVIGPDDTVVVNKKYEGNSFIWTPSGEDGAYRYDVRVVPISNENGSSDANQATQEDASAKSDYAGGSVEVVNGQIEVDEEIPNKEEE